MMQESKHTISARTNTPVRDAEGPRGPVDLGFGRTEAERRPQVQI